MDPYQSPKSRSQYSDGGSTSGLILFERAVRELVRHWKTLLVASAIPILVSSFIELARTAYLWSLDPDSDNFWVTGFFVVGLFWISVPFFVMFATSCHRVVLLGENSLPNKFGLYWSWNETRFVGWIFVLGLVGALATIPVYILVWAFTYLELYAIVGLPIAYLALLPSTYFDGRLGLVLPATAIGSRMKLSESWRATSGVGWAIFFALLIPIAIIEAVEFIIFRRLIDSASLTVYFLETILLYPLIAIGVAVLTIVYRDFGREDRDEDDDLSR